MYHTTDIAQTYGVNLIDEGLDLDQHRWYSIATNIYKCSDGYVKVKGAFQSFSEMQMWSDIDVHSEAEKLQGDELRAFELRMKAYAIEKGLKQKTELEKEPKKTTIVKRVPKKAKEAEKKATTDKTTAKRGNTTEKKVKPANEPKKPKNESRKKMLNDDPEI